MGPEMVLLPEPTNSWRSYEPVQETIPLSIRSIAVSQRGHGDSDKPLLPGIACRISPATSSPCSTP